MEKIDEKLTLAGAIIALTQAGIVQAQDNKPCISKSQAQALISYVLPKAVEASRLKCAAALPSASLLLEENSEQLARYNAASEAAWPEARQAVNIFAGDKLPEEMDDGLVRPIADAMFTQLISEEIKPKHCTTIDKIYTDLAPMPSSNIASLTVTIIEAATKDDEKTTFPICKTPN